MHGSRGQGADAANLFRSSQGPLAAFVERIRSVLNTTGAALHAAGHKCLGELILESVDTRAAAGAPPSAAALVGALAEAIPGFDDKGLYEGQQVGLGEKPTRALLGEAGECGWAAAAWRGQTAGDPLSLQLPAAQATR